MTPIRPLTWPKEYWIDEHSGQHRPIVRCAEENCQLAKRGLAFTYLDVKFPKVICGECKTEFEFTLKDCTHPYASLAPPIGESSKGKGKAKGYGEYIKGKGKGKSPSAYKGGGKGKGINGEAPAGGIDVMAVLLQYGKGIISEDQANKMKEAMKIAPAPLMPKTQVQLAQAEYKAATAQYNGAMNQLKQTKDNILELNEKFKVLLLKMCNQTASCTALKQDVIDCKAKLDIATADQEDGIDKTIALLAQQHATAVAQIQLDEELSNHDGENGDDCNHPDDHWEPKGAEEPTDAGLEVEDAEMQQVAVKRHAPLEVPEINDLPENAQVEDIMGAFAVLNTAKKSKSTPRGEAGE
jgi:hypothetical protein